MDVTIGEVVLALETFICGMALELGLQSGTPTWASSRNTEPAVTP